MEREKEVKSLRDGEPCSHVGCLHHVSHPCEGCGRIGGVHQVCGVNGCTRRAVTGASGWPAHKESVHSYFHELGCPHCDSESHCLVDCEANLRNEQKLTKIFGDGGSGYDWEGLRK